MAAGLLIAAGALYLYQDQRLPDTPGFHERNCWFDRTILGETRCGFMVVAEHRQDPESRLIRLPVVVFAAQKHVPRKEPILFLTGGPGGSAYLAEQYSIEGWWEQRRLFPQGHDLIVMGQRGTGLKNPDFACDEFSEPEIGLWAYPTGTPPPDFKALTVKAAAACAARLQSEGVDLTAYNSRESAADIAELRLALGIDQWTLYGISYGTRLALSALRYHPEGIRAVILDSVIPPEVDQTPGLAANFRTALNRVFRDCAARPACAKRYGDLEAAYETAAGWLDETKPSFTLGEILGSRDQVFMIDGRRYNYSPSDDSRWNDFSILFDKATLDELLFDALYTKETRLRIPRLLQQSALKQTASLQDHFRDYLLYSLSFDVNAAVYLSHTCHDEAPHEDPLEISAAIEEAGSFGSVIGYAWSNYLCDHWPAGNADPVENTPVASGLPALLLSGYFDPITPSTWAWSAAAHLPNGYAYELAGAGHGVIFESACAQRLMAAFLKDLARPPTTHCAAWEISEAPGG